MILFLLLVLTQSAFSQWYDCLINIPEQRITTIAVNEGNVFAGTSLGDIYYSSDYGETWSKKSTTPFAKCINTIVISEKYIIAGTSKSILISTDNGNSWENRSHEVGNKSANGIAINGSRMFASSFENGIFLSTDEGTTWIPKKNGIEGMLMECVASVGNYTLVGTYSRGIYISEDFGENWIACNKGMKSTGASSLLFTDSNFLAGTYGMLYMSTDKGKNWSGKIPEIITSLTTTKDYVFAGTFGDAVYLSRNEGETWLKKYIGITDYQIHSVAVGGGYAYAGSNKGKIFRAKLTDFDVKPYVSNIYNIAIDANTSININFTINGNAPNRLKIIKECDNTDLLPLDSIKISGTDTLKVLAISPRKNRCGSAFVNLKVTDGIDTAQESFVVNVLKTSKAVDNYFTDGLNIAIQPNPATENITISLNNGLQPIGSTSSLSIYNSLGIEIKQFTNNELAGQTSLNFSTEGLASGIYYCTYTSGTDNITKSFIVIK